METIPVSLIYTAILRVEDAPTLHEELSRRFGVPSTSFSESSDQRGSLWALESPLSVDADINEHFAWAAALVEQHEDFFRQLVSSGVRVTLHLACDTNLGYASLGFDTHLFAPLVRTGVCIEFYAGFNSTNVG